MADNICPYACSYKTNSGYCGYTGGYESCQYRKFRGYDSGTHQFIVEPVAAQNLVYKSVKTNADRIRAMTDEELAEFLNSVMIDATRHGSLGSPLHVCGGEGVRTFDWLKQEVSE